MSVLLCMVFEMGKDDMLNTLVCIGTGGDDFDETRSVWWEWLMGKDAGEEACFSRKSLNEGGECGVIAGVFGEEGECVFWVEHANCSACV